MVIFKEGILPKPKTTIDENDECARIGNLMAEAMEEPIKSEDPQFADGALVISETFRVPGTDEVLEKGTVITISK